MNILSKIKNIFWPTKQNKNQPLILSDRLIEILILLFFLIKVLFSLQVLVLQRSSLFAELNAQKIIELTNQIRAQYGLPPVKENNLLDRAAQLKVYDMATNKYFAHYSPTGISPWYWFQKAGYRYHYAGENLAMNFIDSEEVVKAWFNSPSHRENLLNPNYVEIGIAILPSDPQINGLNKPLVVQLFGSPSTKTITPTTYQKPQKITSSTTLSQKVVLGTEEKLAINNNSANKRSTTSTLVTTSTLQATQTTIQVTTTNTTSTTTTILNQNIVSNNLNSSSTKIIANEKVIEKELIDTRSRINKINYFIALIIIISGTIVLVGTVLNYKNITFNYGDLILRIFILIFIGVSFITFKLETFIGNLIVAT